MITLHVESFEERLTELKKILPEHYKELALNQDKVPLLPQFDVYIRRERSGELLFVTLRDSGDMVGYFIGFVAPGLHYASCLTCIMDIFYVVKEKRRGTAGVRLFRFVEQELRRRGVDRWFMGSKVHSDASALFRRIGAELVETTYTKWIGA